MADLPKEVYLEIFSHLPQRYLLSISQTCRSFAALAKPLIFEEVSFAGDVQQGRYYLEGDQFISVLYPGRSKTVDMLSLETSVDEIIELGIAPYVKKFKFGPKHYIDDFWRKYQQWIIDDIDRDHYEQDFHNMSEEDDFEDDEEFGYIGVRRIVEERRLRPERERSLIEAADKIWSLKTAEQHKKADRNKSALVRLFANMPNLKNVEICEWKCQLEEYGIEERTDDVVERQFAGCKPVWAHLELLSHALQASNRHIKHLTLPGIDPLSLTISSSLESLFGSLTTFSFNSEDIAFMKEESSQDASVLTKLIGCASQTLQSLDFRNISTSHPQLPEIGEHFLERLVGRRGTDPTETAPLVFPNLKTLKLRSMILNSPSLITFLSLQPALEHVRFEYVYLATIGYTWADIAQALPPSCTTLYISQCGHEKAAAHLVAAYNYIKDFRPYRDPFPLHAGWRASEALFEKEQEDRARAAAKINWVPPPQWASVMGGEKDERSKEDRAHDLKMRYAYAEFERI